MQEHNCITSQTADRKLLGCVKPDWLVTRQTATSHRKIAMSRSSKSKSSKMIKNVIMICSNCQELQVKIESGNRNQM